MCLQPPIVGGKKAKFPQKLDRKALGKLLESCTLCVVIMESVMKTNHPFLNYSCRNILPTSKYARRQKISYLERRQKQENIKKRKAEPR